MKLLIAPLAAALLLAFATPQNARAAEADGIQIGDISAAKKKAKKAKRSQVHVTGPARGAYGFRNDPSFDPYGRPWRPNFYANCYEDLGYGRFRDCADF